MIAGATALGVRLGNAAWRLAKTPAGRRLAIGMACLLAAYGYGELRFKAGVAHQQAAQAARLKAGHKTVAKVAVQGAAITKEVRQDLEAKTGGIRWRTKTLKEEVTVYVPFEVDRSTVVPVGFVRMHDAAALGAALPGTPGGSVEAASGVALSAVADTIIDNYGTCHIWEAEALAWRVWYPRHAAVWEKYVRPVEPAPEPTP